jgi:translation initiation factor IF-1
MTDPADDTVPVPGLVIEVGPNFYCRVQLDTVDEVRALIPKRVARDMYRVIPGDRVLVRFAESGQPRVTGFAT